jgi:3-oxoacyl-[acyl-carrier protein] reductase
MSERPLEAKVAVVTGAGRGIGRAIALAYADAGASLCCAARTQAQLDEVAAGIRSLGGSAIAVPTDVTDPEAVERMFGAAADAFGGIDIVVINAGVEHERAPVAESDAALWRATLEVNLLGAYYCARTAIPHLRRRGGGKIITIGSGMGHRGLPGGSAYACSKAGLWMLTRVLAQELREANISVNELIPGPVRTALASDPPSGPRGARFQGEWIKAPEDVVPLALFLATQPDGAATAQSFSLMRRDG